LRGEPRAKVLFLNSSISQEAPALLEAPLHRTLALMLNGKQSDMVVVGAASVLARILLQNSAAFAQIMVRGVP
jgi:hypothetical protein